MLNFKVQKGGNPRKRCAIQRQIVIESGSLQACRFGGTKFTTKELLLAYRRDADRGICSCHDASDRINTAGIAISDLKTYWSSCSQKKGAAVGATIPTCPSTRLPVPASEK
jgi:hypothetical protein